MYRNLEAEMARNGLTKKQLAKKLNMRYPTLVDKMNGKNGKYGFYFEEALRIRDVVAPHCELEYLFTKHDREGD